MVISNFKLLETKGNNCLNKVYIAEVDVTTGWWFWKKTRRVRIFRPFGEYYRFLDNGEFTPGLSVENLARAWKAATGEDC